MGRVLDAIAVLLWVGGVVLLVVGIRAVAPAGIFFGFPDTPLSKLVLGTFLVAVAGLLMVLRRPRAAR